MGCTKVINLKKNFHTTWILKGISIQKTLPVVPNKKKLKYNKKCG